MLTYMEEPKTYLSKTELFRIIFIIPLNNNEVLASGYVALGKGEVQVKILSYHSGRRLEDGLYSDRVS